MTKKDWTNKLHDRMADYESVVPEGLWDDIEQSLSEQQVVRPFWRRWISIAAVVAITIGAGWWLLLEGNMKQTAQLTKQPSIVQGQHQLAHQELLPDTPSQPVPKPQPQSAHQLVASITSPKTQEEKEEPEKVEPTVSTKETPENQPVEKKLQTKEPQRELPVHHHSPKSNHRLSIGLLANSGLLSNNSRQNRTGGQITQNDITNGYTETSSPTSELAFPIKRQHHDHPILLGLTVSYPLNSRWTLQTGLVYTRLHSEFETIAKQTQVYQEQTLHYLDIPLSVQYRVLRGKHWQGYMTAGTETDWNLNAKSMTTGVETPIDKDRPQWSLSGALGVEYDVLPQLGIYLEPGIRYYFVYGSQMQNFFKDQPFSWSLQFGIRLNMGK